MKRVKAFFDPSQYHGWKECRKFFEGWYFKVVDRTEGYAMAVIPGIAMDEEGRSQAFIQVLDGKKSSALYKKFDSSSFIPASGKFEIEIEDNFFSENRLRLNLPEVSGELFFSGHARWPRHWYSPGIMGPYSFVPFMECYHGIVSMDHAVQGSLKVCNESIDFSEGRGYIEKDWGHSFPAAYIWMQTNHFSDPEVSFFASVAKIPWLRSSFTGFIAALRFRGQLVKFTTYNRTVLRKCRADREKVEIVMENKDHCLEIMVKRNHAASLSSPIQGFMNGRIEESMTSEVSVTLREIKRGSIIFQDRGRNAGLDVAGDIGQITV